jgi:hypothetical protein
MSAWTITAVSAEWGMVPNVDVVARRKCGREERFSVDRWPTGWKILRLDLNIPATVRRDAFALAREIWPDECFNF